MRSRKRSHPASVSSRHSPRPLKLALRSLNAGPSFLSANLYLFCDIRQNMAWTVETLNAAVDRELEALPPDMRARLARLAEIIEELGFAALPGGSVKHLEDKLWELRITGRDGISRAIYVTATGRRMVIPAGLHQKVAGDAASGIGARSTASQGGEMTRVRELHKRWVKDATYRGEYEALAEEFELATAIAKARSRAGLSQVELARRMKTTQSVIARLESGRGRPSTRTLDRFAKAAGHKLRISFEPVRGGTPRRAE